MTFGPYSMFMDFAIMSFLLFISQIIRSKVSWIQHLYIPSAMVAGFIGLFFGSSFIGYIDGYVSTDLTEYALPFSHRVSSYPYLLVVVLFASLYIGNTGKQSIRQTIDKVGDTFALNMAAEFSGFGFALVVGGGLLLLFVPDLSSTFAILQPAGFVGGHGYAAAIGTTLEESAQSPWGANEAITIGQTFATIGILCGIFGGMASIKWATHKKYTRYVSKSSELPESVKTGFIAKKDQSSIGKTTVNASALDPVTWHGLLILIAAGSGYWLYHFFRELFPSINLPMMCLAMLSGVLLQKMLGWLKLQHTVDKSIINRMGSTITDYLVAFGIASIKISVVVEYAVPIMILAFVGVSFPFLYLFVISKRMFHNHWFERGIFIFGWSTGVVAMGVTLLRVVDPEFKSRALEDYGVAYIFIAMVEIAIVSIVPSIVALSYTTGNIWYAIIPGLIMLSIAAILLFLTAKRYGVQSSDGAEPRKGEDELVQNIQNQSENNNGALSEKPVPQPESI